jgi:hypothetical protein
MAVIEMIFAGTVLLIFHHWIDEARERDRERAASKLQNGEQR